MNKKGMALVEIMVGMIVLAIAALAVSATISMINSKEMRQASGGSGGGSLDIQALGFAKEQLELLKNAVSTDPARAALLSAGSHNTSLPAAFSGTRTYLVEDIDGTDLKKVKVTVQWTDT